MESRVPAESFERVVVILEGDQRIEGNLHVPRHSRLLDILNHQTDSRPFLALTEAKWTRGGATESHEFVCLNRAQIIAAHPAK